MLGRSLADSACQIVSRILRSIFPEVDRLCHMSTPLFPAIGGSADLNKTQRIGKVVVASFPFALDLDTRLWCPFTRISKVHLCNGIGAYIRQNLNANSRFLIGGREGSGI